MVDKVFPLLRLGRSVVVLGLVIVLPVRGDNYNLGMP